MTSAQKTAGLLGLRRVGNPEIIVVTLFEGGGARALAAGWPRKS